MRVLIIGGTGLISTGVAKHLNARGASVVMYNRGARSSGFQVVYEQITGDRNEFASFEERLARERFDVVIDMICFAQAQAESAVRAFAGRCEQYILCSTVCVYGVNIAREVLVDESFAPEPVSTYARGKLTCEQILLAAGRDGCFKTTIVRPSCTYGPGASIIDNLEFDPPTWDRIEKGLPVLCAGDGLGLWQATHRDDVGKLFAHAALNPKTYGEVYNATCDEVMTWSEYYRRVGLALGKRPKVLFMPARWIVAHEPSRFGLLDEITGYHGAYSSEKARRDVPEFTTEVDFVDGVRETLTERKRNGRWRIGTGDAVYETMVEKALGVGVEPVEL